MSNIFLREPKTEHQNSAGKDDFYSSYSVENMPDFVVNGREMANELYFEQSADDLRPTSIAESVEVPRMSRAETTVWATWAVLSMLAAVIMASLNIVA